MNQLDQTALCRRPNKKLWMYGKTHLLEQPCSHIKVMKGMDIQLDLYPLMTRRRSRYPSQETGFVGVAEPLDFEKRRQYTLDNI